MFAVTAYAAELCTDVDFASSGSTVGWVEDAPYGYVVELDTVGTATGSDYAIVQIDVDTDITLATIVTYLPTFMYKLVTIDSADNFLALEMFFTSEGGGEAEISIFPYVSAVPWDNIDTEWQEATGHSGATFANAYGETDIATPIVEEGGSRPLTEIIAAIDALDGGAVDLADYELTRVGVQIGWVAVPTGMVAHIDYIEVEGTTYDLEPPHDWIDPSVTVTKVPITIGVTGTLAFGEMDVGEVSATPLTFTVTASGTDAAVITSTLGSGDHKVPESFWMTYLSLECPEGTAYNIASTDLTHTGEATEVYTFSAILDLAGAPPGTYSDTLIFWATPVAP